MDLMLTISTKNYVTYVYECVRIILFYACVLYNVLQNNVTTTLHVLLVDIHIEAL